MREHSFEHVARAIERALRAVEAQVERARIHVEQAALRAEGRAVRAQGRFGRAGHERWRFEVNWARQNRPGRRPRHDRGEGGSEPEPVPVRPLMPNTLSGGAEAPLDE